MMMTIRRTESHPNEEVGQRLVDEAHEKKRPKEPQIVLLTEIVGDGTS